MKEASEFYNQEFAKSSKELNQLTLKLKGFVWYRLIVFLTIPLPFIFFGLNWWASIPVFILIILFFYLIKINVLLEKKRKKVAVINKITEDELLALKHSFLHFPDGKEFLDVDHFFAYDLDLFGKGSLFQFLNRTATRGGYLKLANWLKNPSTDEAQIYSKQKAVQELSKIPEWRLDFLAEGNLFEETEELSKEIMSWSETQLQFPNSDRIKWFLRIIPVLTILAVIPVIFNDNYTFFTLLVLVQWLFLYLFWKRVTHYFRFFGRKSKLLQKYTQLLELIENEAFDSQLLKKLANKVKNPSAKEAFRQLRSHVKEFEYRQNMLVGFALNSLFMWDIRCMFRLWKWHNKYQHKLQDWLSVIAEMDALISVANFTNNHPEYIFPKIQADGFNFETENMGHPLLDPLKRVDNSFAFSNYPKVLIVTGANMAGKSTFLRTLGVNLLLAEIGAPVCATSFTFTPILLYTNMRTTDSLLKDESYFYAELKRIKTVLDRLQNGERYFVILDEMLKGTNSIDKLNGSKELVRKMVQFGAVAVIATHDLKLSEMEKEIPEAVINKCFEIRIENDELNFDYKLSDGVTKTMNATFLMKKMGII